MWASTIALAWHTWEILADEQIPWALAFLNRAIDWFDAHDIVAKRV